MEGLEAVLGPVAGDQAVPHQRQDAGDDPGADETPEQSPWTEHRRRLRFGSAFLRADAPSGPGGGTGRRGGLKIPCPSGRAGSSPAPGTVPCCEFAPLADARFAHAQSASANRSTGEAGPSYRFNPQADACRLAAAPEALVVARPSLRRWAGSRGCASRLLPPSPDAARRGCPGSVRTNSARICSHRSIGGRAPRIGAADAPSSRLGDTGRGERRRDGRVG